MDEEIKGWLYQRVTDAIGLACPLPVLKARKALANMRPGERLLIAASDPMAAIDIPHMCHEDGHRLVDRATASDGVGKARLYFLVVSGDTMADDGPSS